MHMRGRSPGRTLGRYLRPDGYGTLLLLIVASILLVAVASDVNDLTRVLWLALTGGSLLVALRASGARSRVLAAGAVLVGAVLLISPVMHVFGGKAPAAVFDNAAAALLLVGAAVASGRRLARHPVIAISTVLGAVCLYLLVGMFFGALFALLGDLEGGNFFASATGTTTIDYLYFSFSTMTTVGDGTLTPQGNLERMLAVSEAVAGQLYLVTVIAFLAANFGHAARRRPESDRARSGRYAGRASVSGRGRPRRRVGRHGAVPTR
jgi:Ion channel